MTTHHPNVRPLDHRPALFDVWIPGPPKPQGRGRIVRIAGNARIADPKGSRSWKGMAQVHMQEVCPSPLDGPLLVEILVLFPCPTSDHRKSAPRPRRWHTKATGDVDNLAKASLDAGNGVLWIDDRQVAMLTVRKLIAAQGEAPGVLVKVARLGEVQS